MKYHRHCKRPKCFGGFILLAAIVLAGCGGQDKKAALGSEPPDGILKLTVDRPVFGGGSPQGTPADTLFLEEAAKMIGLELDITWREAPWGGLQ